MSFQLIILEKSIFVQKQLIILYKNIFSFSSNVNDCSNKKIVLAQPSMVNIDGSQYLNAFGRWSQGIIRSKSAVMDTKSQNINRI